MIISAVSCLFSDLASQIGCLCASIVLHQTLLRGVLRAPMAFFDKTPLGRILSRFSADIEVVDDDLQWCLADVMYCTFEV